MSDIVSAPRVLIAGTGSGCGKTTAVCALLQALKDRGEDLASFKCGPDYIDPMFHSRIIGVDAMNVDLFFSSASEAGDLFARHSAKLNVIEGVMGYFDGMSMDSEAASSYDVAGALDAPAILVVNVRGMALSAAALINGYRSFRSPDRIKGVIFNRAGEGSYGRLKKTVERECGIPVLGYLPEDPDIALKSRHLGLITASEVEDLPAVMRRLAEHAERTLEIDRIKGIMRDAPPVERRALGVRKRGDFTLAVAQDEAFCFYYRANLEYLEALGAKLEYFSPVRDRELPGCDGLLLGGGYPELHAKELSENLSMRSSVKKAVEGGLPVIAECGGFMYLCRDIEGFPMAGVFGAGCRGTGKLSRFGYACIRAEEDSLLLKAGDAIRGHEFHYFDASDPGSSLIAVKPGGASWRCAYAGDTYYAGYPHLYLPSCPGAAERFADKCLGK